MAYTCEQSQPIVWVKKVTHYTDTRFGGSESYTTEEDHYEEPTTGQVFGYNANGFAGFKMGAERTDDGDVFSEVTLTNLADEMPMKWTLEVTITDLTDFSKTTREDIVTLVSSTIYLLQCSANNQALRVTAESFESPV